MSNQDLDYAAIDRNIEKNLEREKRLYRMIFFWTHLIFYLVTMAVVWGITLTNSQLRAALFENGFGAALIVILPTLLWAVAILCHVAALFVESDVAHKEMRDKMLLSEIGEEILRKGILEAAVREKVKRRAKSPETDPVKLSDDGELVQAEADEHLEQNGDNARVVSAHRP